MKEVKGSGFFRVLFKMNVLPIILLTIVFTTFSAMRFAASMKIETKNGLVDLSHTVVTLFDKLYEGDYRTEVKDGGGLLWKGDHLLIGAACGLIAGCNSVSFSSIEPGFYELAVEPVLTTLSVLVMFSIVFYIILKQNPYRNFRRKELIFSDEVRSELQQEFSKMKKALLSGIAVCLLIVGINELQFAVWISRNWQTMYLLDSVKMRWDDVLYMVMAGVCVFVMVFCAGVYWSYAVLLSNCSSIIRR